MLLAKVRHEDGKVGLAVVEDEVLRPLDLTQAPGYHSLSDILHAEDPIGLTRYLVDPSGEPMALETVRLLPPVDRQEIWAAGVTYKRSQVARMEESESGASHYDKVYTAPRPELFLKATAERCVGPADAVRVRYDSRWTVPEPEWTLLISPDLRIVGHTLGNDMSARDIEGENPLYLPQAKVYDQSAAVGPWVWLPEEPFDRRSIELRMRVRRGGETVFEGTTSLGEMARTFEELVSWLGREISFPHGALLMTGTGIVPDDDFTLLDGDVVFIEADPIGVLTNPVVKREPPEA
ncbi:MAG: 2-hydroxyhepta-2,4-diene-1,7-dioate isomerase [Planctomycetota bacterium]|nr:MAG: 2-hydroxyhepta-2,4-diene-1,7-dioate isomerase [Planctomycetota bacterium]